MAPDSSLKVADRSLSELTPERVGYVVGRIDRKLRRNLSEQLAPLGLSCPEYTVLSHLNHEPGMSGAEMARRTLVSPQAINEMIATLEERELIERSVDPAHGRILQMRLTGHGTETLASARGKVETVEAQLLDGVGDDDRAALIELLWRCAENIGAGVPGAKRS